jgi:predicted hotdog family 3-hydroxylacyl-ACP dehydratase
VTAPAGDAPADFGPVADYLPHRPPMRLVDRIVAFGGDRCVCRATIQPDCVFAIEGVVHPSALIEFVAQACAVYVGMRDARDGTPPRTGLLMACREVDFAVDALAVGDELTLEVTKIFGQSQQAAFKARVTRGEALCATVQLSVVDAALAGSLAAAGAGE